MSNELDDGGRTPAHRAAFTACWQRDAGRVHAYAVRHVGPDDAAEVMSEAFLAAWRRWPQVPDPPLPWLIGAARKAAANHRRGRDRRRALQQWLELASADGAEVDTVPEETRRTALETLAGLGEADREALLLVAWDGLTADQAAAALGIRPATFRVRLHRARARLAAALEPTEVAGPPRPFTTHAATTRQETSCRTS